MKFSVLILYVFALIAICKQTKQIEKLCKNIKRLNVQLFNLIFDLPKSKGGIFLNKIRQYNDNMTTLARIVRTNKTHFQRQLGGVLKKGYPKYLAENVFEEEMKKKFNFNQSTFEVLKVLRTASYDAWADLISLHEQGHTFFE
uniref:Uncharacterized protein n=1 Tax=Clastoptera arizonana TaxID=38151 RepID=A0A1B6CEP3_9HEMI